MHVFCYTWDPHLYTPSETPLEVISDPCRMPNDTLASYLVLLLCLMTTQCYIQSLWRAWKISCYPVTNSVLSFCKFCKMQISAVIQNFPFFCNIMQKKHENGPICIYSANSAFFFFPNCRMFQNYVLSQKPNSPLFMLKFLNSAISCKLMGFFYARFHFIHKFLGTLSILQIPLQCRWHRIFQALSVVPLITP